MWILKSYDWSGAIVGKNGIRNDELRNDLEKYPARRKVRRYRTPWLEEWTGAMREDLDVSVIAQGQKGLFVTEQRDWKIQDMTPCVLVNNLMTFRGVCCPNFYVPSKWRQEAIPKRRKLYQSTRRHVSEDLSLYQYHRAMARVVFAGLSRRRYGLYPRLFQMGFVVYKVALRQGFV
jgi:hypothetical protein